MDFGCGKTDESRLDLGVMGEFFRRSGGVGRDQRTTPLTTPVHKDLDECAISRHVAPPMADFGQGPLSTTLVFSKGYFS